MLNKIKSKSEKLNLKWNLNGLLSGDDDHSVENYLKQLKVSAEKFVNKWKGREDYLKYPKILREALDEYEVFSKDFSSCGKVGYYYWLRTHQEQNNSKLKAKYNKIDEFNKEISNSMLFFGMNISKVSETQQDVFLQSNELDKYNHYLEQMFRQAKFLLSENEEKILTLKSTSSHDSWIKMLESFLSKEEREIIINGKKEKKNYSEIWSLKDNPNKKIRDSAAEALNDIIRKNLDVAEAEINAILADKKVDDNLRKMERPDLSRHLNDDIDSQTVDEMINSVSKRFDISQRYYKLVAKLFGVKQLKYHERNVPYGKIDKEVSYEEAVEIVQKVLDNLDERFGKIFSDFIKNGNIDVYPSKGKHAGAFCVYWTRILPTYILLNYDNRLNEVLTLAHEVGHGINDELMKEKQHAIYASTPTSTAEVASTFMEDFVLQEIEREADDELKLALIIMKLKDDVNTIFRQVAGYKFEQELHKEFRDKGYLSKEEIGKLFRKVMESYMGEAVEQSEGSENWWVVWPHIRNFFYVYSYASGLLISKSMQAGVRKNPEFVEKVKEFLSAGSSDSPKNIFLKMGIDIEKEEFWNRGLAEIDNLLSEAEKLAKKLKKI